MNSLPTHRLTSPSTGNPGKYPSIFKFVKDHII